MSNSTWVCFGCRQVVRRPASGRAAVKCPRCGSACKCLGQKIPVPLRERAAAWRALENRLTKAAIDWSVRQAQKAIERRHYVEKRILELASRPSSPSLGRQIQGLRRELDGDG